MWLGASNQRFELVLGEAENTASRWWVSYRDTNINLPQTSEGTSNGVTAVTVLAGPTSGAREVVRFFWLNNDNIAHTVKVRQNTGGTFYNEPGYLAIPIGSSLCYHENRGWYVFPTGTATVTAFCSEVVAVSTSNLALTGVPTAQDGITVAAGQRILLAGQSTASQNGVWIVQSGTWGRPPEYASNATLLPGFMVSIGFGTTQADTIWFGVRSDAGQGSFVVDSDGTTWAAFAMNLSGVGPPAASLGSKNAVYFDITDPTQPQLYFKS